MKLFSSLFCLLFFAPAVWGQTSATTGDVIGVVSDQSKAVLPGVSITVTNTGNGFSRNCVSKMEGRYTCPALVPGTYSLRAELPAFAPQTRDEIVVTIGGAIQVDLTLAIAGTTETLLVTEFSSVIDTQKTALANVVSQEQIESLPINGRNVISFSIITPGVTTDRLPQQGASTASGLTFGGQRARTNNITVDGVDNNDSSVGAVRATFSQEAVREFQVLANSYPAEFGRASGGVVNIVTRSGANRISGGAFLYFRSQSLNAKEHFEKFDPAGAAIDRVKAPYGQKQFGATLGGPIKRDRSFYFLAVERLDVDANNFVTIDDKNPVLLGASSLGTPKQILERAGFPIQTGHVPYQVKTNTFLGKIDHQLTSRQSLALRFNYGHTLNENIEPWGGQVARSRGASLDSTDYMLAAAHTFWSASGLVNESRFQYAFRDQVVNALDPKCNGACVRDDQGGPTIEVAGYANAGRQRFTPQPRHPRRWQVLDNVSYQSGKHFFKTGFDANVVHNKNEALPLHFGGRYVFAASLPGAPLGLPYPTINAIQAVSLGFPAAYVQGYGNTTTSYTASDLSAFVQDDWRISSRFTAKFGLRYQRQFWSKVDFVAPGLQPYSIPDDNNNIAPRLAFAWDPTGSKRTSIRGAYGLFFENQPTSVAGITDILDGGANGVRTFVAQFPNALPSAAWNTPGRRLSEAAVGAYPSLKFILDPAMRTPYAHHLTAGVDRELRKQIAVSASFVYVAGRAQLGTIDYNPVVPSLGAGRRPDDIGGIARTSASVLQYTSFGESLYRGLTVTANKRFSDNYQFFSSYTLSKSEDNSADYQSAFIPQYSGRGRDPQNPKGLPIGFNPDSEKGASVQDQRHRLVVSGVYALPKAFQLSSIVTAGSGRPYTILAGTDLNGDGNGGAAPPDRARRNPADETTALPRNSATFPKELSVDFRLRRRFNLSDRAHLDGLFEVFNLFNHTNYIDVNNIFGTGIYPNTPAVGFGQFTQAGSPRQIQLAIKVGF